jgi:hypothetical protein
LILVALHFIEDNMQIKQCQDEHGNSGSGGSLIGTMVADPKYSTGGRF